MSARIGKPIFLAIALLAMTVAANSQQSPQKPPAVNPIAPAQTENRAVEWTEIVARSRPAVVVIETDEGLGTDRPLRLSPMPRRHSGWQRSRDRYYQHFNLH
jgi:hypothetical protein